MRKILIIAATALFLVGCSSKTSEEKALDDAMKEFQETVGTVFGEMSPTITVSKETAKSWPEKFCSLEVNMTKDQVRAVMGEPTNFFNDSTANQDQYDGWGYDLVIFYDIDDLAQQMQSNSDNVPCETKFRP